MGRRPKYDSEKILNLRATGERVADIAAQVGTTSQTVNSVIERARKKGDKRALLRDAAPVSVAHQKDRPGVMVITVTSSKLDGEGVPKRIPISLPRLSILEGWTGAS